MGDDMKNMESRYKALRRRADECERAIATLEGERNVYITKLKSMGFNTLQEAKDYVAQKQREETTRLLELKEKLDRYEEAVSELELKLGGNNYGRW
jgi:chromosome segregation ATPase